MDILALDLSKRSTGWARWDSDLPRPTAGIVTLGNQITSAGKCFLNLHSFLADQFKMGTPDVVIYEKPLNLGQSSMATNEETLFLLIGLACHVDSFCEAKCVSKLRHVHAATWRRHFLGKMPKAKKSAELKSLAVERCAQLGLPCTRHDMADAYGILDYMIHVEGITPPWAANEVLRPELGAVA